MNSSVIITIIYVIGIIIGALGLGVWDADTNISKAMLALGWTVIFLIGIFLSEKINKFYFFFLLNLCKFFFF